MSLVNIKNILADHLKADYLHPKVYKTYCLFKLTKEIRIGDLFHEAIMKRGLQCNMCWIFYGSTNYFLLNVQSPIPMVEKEYQQNSHTYAEGTKQATRM